MLRYETTDWMDGPAFAECEPIEPVAELAAERIVLKRSGSAQLVVDVQRDLLGAYVVTRCAVATRRPPRATSRAHLSLDDAMIEAGAHIHRALSRGYRFERGTAFSSRL